MALIQQVITIYVWIVIARILLSWFPYSAGPPIPQLKHWTGQLTDPVLRPLRQVLPDFRAGGMMIDLAPLVLIIALNLLRGAIG